jgi:type I restriction enzyme M protein
LDADIKAGASTITDPQFLDGRGGVRKFSLVLANFPFSDEMWWLRPEQQTDDKKKKSKLKKEIFGKEGFKDQYGRFGRGTPFRAPPANYGDYAFILHILASLNNDGRAGVVCPQGVLFRGQPEVDPGEAGAGVNGSGPSRSRKADDEYLIRRSLLDGHVVDAVIALPLNIFYGAGVPACLLILRKARPPERRDKLLLVYAARYYRELSAQNELRPQDVMRILIHYHAYGDADKVPGLLSAHRARIGNQINARERDAIGILEAEYESHADKVRELDSQLAGARKTQDATTNTAEKKRLGTVIRRVSKQKDATVKKLAERDARIAEVKRWAQEDRQDVELVANELLALYADPDELTKHARVALLTEIEENEFNLNVPRYVDTFEPEPHLEVHDALALLVEAREAASQAERELTLLLEKAGYAD